MMLADSDVLIDFLRGKGRDADRIQLELSTGRLHTTTINAFELISGAKSPKERAKVDTLLEALHVLPLDLAAAVQAANVRRELEERGKGIGAADYLIAGVCLAHGATLLTRNLKHFERVPGLKVGIRLG
jgi:tRNA(fMet)-specific endonuclease VapC